MWVLDMDQSYHYRKWENQCADIRNNPFISSLIKKGKFDSKNLETSALVHDKVNFKTLFSSSLSSSIFNVNVVVKFFIQLFVLLVCSVVLM